MSEPSKSNKAVRFVRQQVMPLVVLVVALFSVRSSVADWNDVPTGSMKPSILEGDRIYVNKLAYGLKVPFTTIHLARWDTPARGEVVVFFNPAGTRMVKRVAALPGDTIELSNNHLLINGKPADYAPLAQSIIDNLPPSEQRGHGFLAESIAGAMPRHPVMSTPANYGIQRTFGPVKVPEGYYFMLGDNRDNSADSREWGFVPQDQIVGRASRVVVSLDPEHSYKPRWSRFFEPLP